MSSKPSQITSFLELIRPQQWIKNLLIFAAILFAHRYSEPQDWFHTMVVFIAFSLSASGIYIINDYFDRESDKKHPVKRNRPFASDRISPAFALPFAIVLFIVGIGLSSQVNPLTTLLIAGYILMMILYSAFLKHVLVLDMLILSVGIVLRAVIGAVAISVEISHWLLICVFFAGLMLASAKRRYEVKLSLQESFEPRASLQNAPSLANFDGWCIGFGIVTMVTYALYSVDIETIEKIGSIAMLYTLPFVVFGILRFQMLIFTRDNGDDAIRTISRDATLLVDILLWLIVSYWIISKSHIG